jgi:hypothetical protein
VPVHALSVVTKNGSGYSFRKAAPVFFELF